MGEFFKPGRRKFGVLTLVVACVSVVGWARSLTIVDEIRLPNNSSTTVFIGSADGRVYWCRFYSPRATEIPLGGWDYASYPLSDKSFEDQFRANGTPCTFEWYGFGTGSKASTKRPSVLEYQFWVIPYFSIVIPLTLLSAYSLLAKPTPETPFNPQGLSNR